MEENQGPAQDGHHWPRSWLATLRHVYANPAYMFASRWAHEAGGPGKGEYGLFEDAFIKKALGDENALNDVMNVTLALLPDGFHQRLADRSIPGRLDLSAAVDATHDYPLRYRYAETGGDVTQPDHLHVGPGGMLGIELKVRAKSSVKQLLHYAVLAICEERLHQQESQHLLIILSPRDSLRKAMDVQINDAEEARGAMLAGVEDYLAASSLRRKFVTAEELSGVIPRMTIAHLGYAEFVATMRAEEDGSSGPAASTLRRLIDGAEAEFRRHAAIARCTM